MTAIRQLCAHEGCDNTIEARVGPGLCDKHADEEDGLAAERGQRPHINNEGYEVS